MLSRLTFSVWKVPLREEGRGGGGRAARWMLPSGGELKIGTGQDWWEASRNSWPLKRQERIWRTGSLASKHACMHHLGGSHALADKHYTNTGEGSLTTFCNNKSILQIWKMSSDLTGFITLTFLVNHRLIQSIMGGNAK